MKFFALTLLFIYMLPASSIVSRWDEVDLPISFQIEQSVLNYFSDSTSTTNVDTVLKKWNQESFLTFFGANTVSAGSFNYSSIYQYSDGVNSISSSSTWFTDVSSFALSITFSTGIKKYDSQGKEYVALDETDIILNAKSFNFGDVQQTLVYDIASVLLHEAGHAIGLGKIRNCSNCVMSPRMSSGKLKRELHPRDLIEVGRVYYEDQSDRMRIISDDGERVFIVWENY